MMYSYPIYHITNLENLEGIIKAGGLYATNDLNSKVVSVAYEHIQKRRAAKRVPFGGHLHDYVPFYFCPRSPMLYAIHSQTAQMAYKGGQQPMLHLVTTAQQVEARDLQWVFSDRHAVLDYAQFFTDFSMLKTALDWQAIRANSWGNSMDYPDRKERKQAEFLVQGFAPWDLIQNIGVYDSSIETQVQAIFAQAGAVVPPITVRRDWYY